MIKIITYRPGLVETLDKLDHGRSVFRGVEVLPLVEHNVNNKSISGYFLIEQFGFIDCTFFWIFKFFLLHKFKYYMNSLKKNILTF